jgi:hypothetical protein
MGVSVRVHMLAFRDDDINLSVAIRHLPDTI